MQALWLYLHFPNLQLDALFQQQHLDTQTKQPIIILNTNSNNIVQLNQAASAEGIKAGMGLATAAALAPHLNVIPYKQEVEEKKLIELAELLYLVTSDITLYKPNGILLRMHNMLRLYGGLEAYWQTLQNQLASQKLRYQYATGHSPNAARMFSRAGFNHINSDHRWLKQRSLSCQLAQTDLPLKTIELLHRVGVRTIAELLNIPQSDIAKRFDIHLVNYIGRLTGEFQHPVDFFHPKERFNRYLELLYDIENVQTLLHPLKHMLNTLEQYMQVRDQLTHSLHITLYQRDIDVQSFQIGSAHGDYKAEQWLKLIELKLESINLDAPVFAIQLETGVIQNQTPGTVDLFSKQGNQLSHAQLFSLLSAKLGEQALLQPCIHNDHRPEHSADYTKPLQGEIRENSPPYHSLKHLRPSFLFQSPQPLREKTTLLCGPERIASGWWEHQHITRDYYIARTEQGRYYWLFKTPERQWFLHGVFSWFNDCGLTLCNTPNYSVRATFHFFKELHNLKN